MYALLNQIYAKMGKISHRSIYNTIVINIHNYTIVNKNNDIHPHHLKVKYIFQFSYYSKRFCQIPSQQLDAKKQCFCFVFKFKKSKS